MGGEPGDPVGSFILEAECVVAENPVSGARIRAAVSAISQPGRRAAWAAFASVDAFAAVG